MKSPLPPRFDVFCLSATLHGHGLDEMHCFCQSVKAATPPERLDATEAEADAKQQRRYSSTSQPPAHPGGGPPGGRRQPDDASLSSLSTKELKSIARALNVDTTGPEI